MSNMTPSRLPAVSLAVAALAVTLAGISLVNAASAPGAAEVAALEQRVEFLEDLVAAGQTGNKEGSTEGLAEELADPSFWKDEPARGPSQLAQDEALSERLGRLEQRVETVAGDAQGVPAVQDQALSGRLSRLEQRVETVAGDAQGVPAVLETLTVRSLTVEQLAVVVGGVLHGGIGVADGGDAACLFLRGPREGDRTTLSSGRSPSLRVSSADGSKVEFGLSSGSATFSMDFEGNQANIGVSAGGALFSMDSAGNHQLALGATHETALLQLGDARVPGRASLITQRGGSCGLFLQDPRGNGRLMATTGDRGSFITMDRQGGNTWISPNTR
jgi:hypothetical protein